MKKILYVPTLNLGVIYWRVEMYAQALLDLPEECQVFVEYFVDPRDELSWESICLEESDKSKEIQNKLRSAFSHFDYIIFQKLQYKDSIALINEYKKEYPDTKILAEVDDSVGDNSIDSHLNFKDAHRWAAEHIDLSDGVITTTEYLRKSMIEMFPSKKIHVAPNCINYNIWDIKPKDVYDPKPSTIPKKYIKFGYVGGYGHDSDLRIAYPAINRMLDKHKDFYFIIRYGGFRPEFLEDHPRIDFKQVSWHTSEYPSKLYEMNIDVGLAPLQDTNFNRCKSAIKWLEWASMDVPTICSNVEPYINIPNVILSENSADEWEKSMEYVYDKLKAKEPVFEGHKTLKEIARDHFNIKYECKNLLKFLDKI